MYRISAQLCESGEKGEIDIPIYIFLLLFPMTIWTVMIGNFALFLSDWPVVVTVFMTRGPKRAAAHKQLSRPYLVSVVCCSHIPHTILTAHFVFLTNFVCFFRRGGKKDATFWVSPFMSTSLSLSLFTLKRKCTAKIHYLDWHLKRSGFQKKNSKELLLGSGHWTL